MLLTVSLVEALATLNQTPNTYGKSGITEEVIDGIVVVEAVIPRAYTVHEVYNDFVVRSTGADAAKLRRAVRGEGANKITVITDILVQMTQQIALGGDAWQVVQEPNAGGASVVSEALSAEYMARRFAATNIVTEMRITYWACNWKKVDYLATMYGERVGVSVTRAMGFPAAEDFTYADARRLIQKKLYGLVIAQAGISPRFAYTRSILHVWCQTLYIAQLMTWAAEELIDIDAARSEPTLAGNIVVICTVCEMTPHVFTEDFNLY